MHEVGAELNATQKLNPRIERCVEFPGMAFILNSEVISGFVDETFCPESHELALNLSPLPSLRNCYFSTATRDALKVGALSLSPANIPYRIVTRLEYYKFAVFRVSPEYYREITKQDDEWDLRKTKDILGTPMNATMLRVAHELMNPGVASAQLLEALGNSLIVDMARLARGTAYESYARQIGHAGNSGLSPEQLRQVMDYVDSIEGQAVTAADIARQLNISVRHFSRLFKASTGRTIHSYVSETRLRKAIALLSNTNISMKEISHRLGFSGQWGFSSSFRSAMGKTPKEFRRQLSVAPSNANE